MRAEYKVATLGEPVEPMVETVMTLSPTCMSPDADLADLAALMLETRARSVPILADGRLVGIVSARDVLRAVVRRQSTSDPALIAIAAEDGVRGQLAIPSRGSAAARTDQRPG